MMEELTNPYDLFAYGDSVETAPEPNEYTVTEVSNKLKSMVESKFAYIRVRGEFSRVTVAKSGHLYTSLKDDKSVLDAIIWKGTLSKLSITPEEGMEVICTGRLTTYPGRSNYQMIIENAEIAGEGALLKMIEERKKKLAAEGLFDEARKKPIPLIPERIGVITSPTGAVIRDIMHRLNERFPRNVYLYPVMVQGEGAAKTVAEGVRRFNLIPKGSPYRPDVLIVARGGGSLEDLMPFNDEELVRAVAASEIPIISAVGHETDTTLIDYAADLRAPTPTAAAEKAVPVKSELITLILDKQKRIFNSAKNIIKNKTNITLALSRAVTSPRSLMENSIQRLDNISIRLDSCLKSWLQSKENTIKQLNLRISPIYLRQRIKSFEQNLANRNEKLVGFEKNLITSRADKLKNLSALLNSYSFERVLDRGFAAIFDEKGNIISSKNETSSGQRLKIRLKDGNVNTKVE